MLATCFEWVQPSVEQAVRPVRVIRALPAPARTKRVYSGIVVTLEIADLHAFLTTYAANLVTSVTFPPRNAG